MAEREIFSTKFQAGKRTYFFDVKQSSPGDKYLVISESRPTKYEKHKHDRILIFQEDLPNFMDALKIAAEWTLHIQQDTTGYTERLKKIREQFPNAYQRWTTDEDARLKELVSAGTSVPDIASLLKRQPSAIRSRLQKLGWLQLNFSEMTPSVVGLP